MDKRAVTGRTKRMRRSPAEARAAVLDAARARLLAHGLEGLKIAAVARDAGMSHATLIHHFGSSLGMRDALIESMTAELLGEFVALLDDDKPMPAERLEAMLVKLFATLSDDRHAQLFAWLTVEPPQPRIDAADYDRTTRDLLSVLLDRVRRRDGARPLDADAARFGAALAVTTAVGLGMARPWLARMGLMEGAGDIPRFAAWVAELLESRRQLAEPSAVSNSPRSATGNEQLKPEQR